MMAVRGGRKRHFPGKSVRRDDDGTHYFRRCGGRGASRFLLRFSSICSRSGELSPANSPERLVCVWTTEENLGNWHVVEVPGGRRNQNTSARNAHEQLVHRVTLLNLGRRST